MEGHSAVRLTARSYHIWAIKLHLVYVNEKDLGKLSVQQIEIGEEIKAGKT